MKKINTLTLLLGMCLLPGCFFSLERRQINTEVKSDAKFLKAEGFGQSEEEARRNAKAELSNIFESRVNSDTTSSVSRVLDARGGENIDRYTAQNIQIVSKVELKGVEISRSWQDEAAGTYRAVAVLDRQKARAIWVREIENIDGKISQSVESASSIQSNFLKMRSLRAATVKWLSRETLVSRLRVLGSSYPGIEGYDIKKIYRDIEELKKSVTVFVDFAESQKKYRTRGEDEIAELLTRDAGYVVVPEKGLAQVSVKGAVAVEKVDLDNPDFTFMRVVLSLIVRDEKTGEVLGEFIEKKRAGHLNGDEAAHKAFYKAMAAAKKELLTFF
ncbi:MAG: hypothetical protein ACE5FU_08585 [Nitrospinota bacterium]